MFTLAATTARASWVCWHGALRFCVAARLAQPARWPCRRGGVQALATRSRATNLSKARARQRGANLGVRASSGLWASLCSASAGALHESGGRERLLHVPRGERPGSIRFLCAVCVVCVCVCVSHRLAGLCLRPPRVRATWRQRGRKVLHHLEPPGVSLCLDPEVGLRLCGKGAPQGHHAPQCSHALPLTAQAGRKQYRSGSPRRLSDRHLLR
jgi:hypothetical protein